MTRQQLCGHPTVAISRDVTVPHQRTCTRDFVLTFMLVCDLLNYHDFNNNS